MSPAAFAPAGGPVPAELLGDWFLPIAAVNAAASCRTPLTFQTCNLRLRLDAATYVFAGEPHPPGPGDVAVNGTEIDFFNAPLCEAKGVQGLGRYTWTLAGAALRLTPINNDPCGRTGYLSNQVFSRSP